VTYGSGVPGHSLTREPASEPSPLRRKWSTLVFQLLACNIACLAIATLYYAWRDVYLHRRKREKLNDRVAYMLWVAANRAA
jgi:hypothetical protein